MFRLDTITDIQLFIGQFLTKQHVNDITSSPVFALMFEISIDIATEKRLSVCER